MPLHADALVDPDGEGVFGPDEQTDRRDAAEEQTAQIAHPSLRVASVPLRRVDPHLLHLDSRRSPRGRLGFEADRAVFGPQPGTPLLDLRTGPLEKAARIPRHRVDADLLLVRRRTRR